jgi:SAM-dependent methyltransferase
VESFADKYWNMRSQTIEKDIDVNTMDVFQRNLEYEYILPYIKPNMDILEVGCGNGYSTSVFRKIAKHVDSFDYTENMIKRAKKVFKETNNRFYVDSLLEPKHTTKKYELVLCIRVLCNLRDVNEQLLAIKNLASFIDNNGSLILLEGFSNGFSELNLIRSKVNLPNLKPAKNNYYSSVNDLLPILEHDFVIEQEIHTGSYDYLTRYVYPYLVGNDKIKRNTEFHEKAYSLAKAYNPELFRHLSRIYGFVLRKKER